MAIISQRPRTIIRALQLVVLVVGLVAATALLQSPATSASHHAGAKADTRSAQLKAASHGIRTSGVDGVAWYVDTASGKVVVTVDKTVSKTEVAQVRRSAGTSADLVIHHASGRFRPTAVPVTRSTAVATGAHSASTSPTAAATTS